MEFWDSALRCLCVCMCLRLFSFKILLGQSKCTCKESGKYRPTRERERERSFRRLCKSRGICYAPAGRINSNHVHSRLHHRITLSTCSSFSIYIYHVHTCVCISRELDVVAGSSVGGGRTDGRILRERYVHRFKFPLRNTLYKSQSGWVGGWVGREREMVEMVEIRF